MSKAFSLANLARLLKSSNSGLYISSQSTVANGQVSFYSVANSAYVDINAEL